MAAVDAGRRREAGGGDGFPCPGPAGVPAAQGAAPGSPSCSPAGARSRAPLLRPAASARRALPVTSLPPVSSLRSSYRTWCILSNPILGSPSQGPQESLHNGVLGYFKRRCPSGVEFLPRESFMPAPPLPLQLLEKASRLVLPSDPGLMCG